MKGLFVFMGMFSALFAASCSDAPATPKTVIGRVGTYLVSSNATLEVSSKPAGILHYELKIAGRTALTSQERPSIHQRWGLLFDDQQRLWVASSDIGVFVWVPQGATYVQHQVANGDQWVNQIPNALKREMSQSLLRALGL